MKTILKIYIIASVFYLYGCSSVKVLYYSKPEKQYEMTAKNSAVPFAQISTDTAVFTVRSESITYEDWKGPAFLPIIPSRTSGLEAEHLWLGFILKTKSDPEKFKGKINIKDFTLKLDNGTEAVPETVYLFEEKETLETAVTDFQNYPFKDGTTFSLKYPEVIYSKVKWYEFSAVLQFKDRKEKSPVFHMTPAKQRTFNLFDFPPIIPMGR